MESRETFFSTTTSLIGIAEMTTSLLSRTTKTCSSGFMPFKKVYNYSTYYTTVVGSRRFVNSLNWVVVDRFQYGAVA